MARTALRWLAISVFILSSTLNYLDRQLLAAVAPTLRREFHLANADYGLLITIFSIVYAVAAPVMGLLIDRVGLNLGTTIAVAFWSAVSAATGLVSTFRGLLFCRGTLGAAEGAAIPATGKANGLYLEPREFALGGAINQVGLTLGGFAAPLLVALLAPVYGWRAVFVVCGVLGFLWIPIWLFTAHKIPPRQEARAGGSTPVSDVMRDRRFWGLVIANILYMTMYTLWTNWTTLYFVEARGMTQAAANRQLAWIPPLFATLGGFFGGGLAYRLIRSGLPVLRARMRVCLLSAVLLIATAAVPLMPTAGWAAAAISFSFFWVTAMSTNIYSMPIDFFGAERAAFGVAALTFAYGLMQAFVSPAIGITIDRYGFASVCVSFAVLPLIAVAVLQAAVSRPARQS
jgi:MFS transporter, ACS family, aldohexuronate transporter